MTAALASTVQHRKGSKNAQIAELVTLIINIIRTQFIAIFGVIFQLLFLQLHLLLIYGKRH